MIPSKRAAFGLVLFVLLLAAGVSRAADVRVHPTDESTLIRVRVDGRWSTYHTATRAHPLDFEIDGPATIRVLSRLLPGGEVVEMPDTYRIRLEVDGIPLRVLEEESGLSRRARSEGGVRVGALRRQTVRLPAGTRSLRIIPDAPDQVVALRVFRGEGSKKNIQWVSFAPQEYMMAVRLQSRETEVVYYRFGEDDPVCCEVYGPLQMKVLTRIDFEKEHGFSQKYAIKVYLDDQLVKTWPFKARVSHVSTYPDLPEITPGLGQTLMIDVPEGKHTITIQLDCTTARSASLRVFIPEKAVTRRR